MKEAYEKSVGALIPLRVGCYIEELYEHGMELEVILNAIEETGWAPNPSPQYLRAILRRYDREGIRTKADLARDNPRVSQTRTQTRNSDEPWWRQRQQNYIQDHNYTDEYFEHGFFYDLDHDHDQAVEK